MREVKKHGMTGYTYGCRCDECRSARAEYQRRRVQTRPDVRAAQLETARRWREDNPDRVRENRKRYRAANYDKVVESEKRWHAENAEATRASKQRWNEANRERRRENARRWEEANRELVREMSRRNAQIRRARQYGVGYEKFDDREVFERDNWMCHLCGTKVNRRLKHPHQRSVSLDHIVPLSRGGVHSRANSACAHLICNIRKGARDGF